MNAERWLDQIEAARIALGDCAQAACADHDAAVVELDKGALTAGRRTWRCGGTNTSGLVGASWSRRTGRWLAQIKVGGKARNLGLHDTAQAAHEAYVAAKAELHTFQPTIRQRATA